MGGQTTAEPWLPRATDGRPSNGQPSRNNVRIPDTPPAARLLHPPAVVRSALLLPLSIACVFAAFSMPRNAEPYTVVASPTAAALAACATSNLASREPESGFLTKAHGLRIDQATLPMHGAAWIYGTPGAPSQSHQDGVHPIGVRRLAFVAHPHREIESLTRAQIAKLYSGEIDNWRQLGGPDAPVRMLRTTDAEDLESVRRFVGSAILTAASPSDIFSGDHRCLRLVTGDPFAIGTMSLDTAERAIDEGAPLRILAVEGQCIGFDEEPGQSPLVRTLQVCVAHPDDHRSCRLLDFFASDEGRCVVAAAGFEPLASER